MVSCLGGSLTQNGKAYVVRTEAAGVVPRLFKAVGVALPPPCTAHPGNAALLSVALHKFGRVA